MNLSNTALIMIDLQAAMRRIVAPFAKPYSYDEVLANNQKLMGAFADAGQPIIMVTVQPKILPKKWAERVGRLILEEDARDLPNVYKIAKYGPNAFTQSDENLEQLLNRQKIKKLVFTGVSTSNGVVKTARTARELHFDVVIVKDATADKSLSGYQKSLEEFETICETKDFVN
ncbi:isochorismatase family cysteine hydrolase [Lactococcus nasutitermitis]|uniref:Isochorismatase family cysteine hydrolase n=1 Tax=Lactococcus nasutitermitis TaxID=1652957 RepID=A0ABV9JEV3_9LACT|nr:isochorismatase family cysteine hydrolase [Lactococcus nasutitermitis]